MNHFALRNAMKVKQQAREASAIALTAAMAVSKAHLNSKRCLTC